MTTFKEKLDQELGEAPRFTQSLQEDILRQVRKTKKTRRWTYPLIIIGTMVMFLLIIEIGPLGQIEQTQHASIVQLAQQQSIKKYTMIYNSDEEIFKAGRPGFVIGQRVMEQSSEKELLHQLLQQATMTQMNERTFFRLQRDVWVEFEKGQVMKLKMFIKEEDIGIVDYDNHSFYKVDNKELAKAYLDLALKEDAKLGMSGLIVMLVIFLAIQMLGDKLMRKMFNIPKEYVNSHHRRAVWAIKILNIIMLPLFMLKGWILFTIIIGGYLAVILFSSIFVDYYYGREEKRHYLSISSAFIGVLSLILFIYYIS